MDPLLGTQFNAGRLYAVISSRPGQSGRADGYILEGKELEVRQDLIDVPCGVEASVLTRDLYSSMSRNSVLASTSRNTVPPIRRFSPLHFTRLLRILISPSSLSTPSHDMVQTLMFQVVLWQNALSKYPKEGMWLSCKVTFLSFVTCTDPLEIVQRYQVCPSVVGGMVSVRCGPAKPRCSYFSYFSPKVIFSTNDSQCNRYCITAGGIG